jgi:tetratricopeptide (TPR) repeat protein
MPDIRLRDYTAKIKKMIREVRLDEAIAHCRHILHHYPKHIETYCLLGEACLEKEMYRESIEFFQRTLSGDPESLISRVGLGVIYDEQGALPEAIWQLERAFELSPGNAEVRRELQRLYARRDGSDKGRLKLTRGALGRLYGRNGLYERAIGEFQAVLYQDPDLPDIQVALAESLWREGRRLEAVETCQDLLEKLPNCLKANLILGAIWVPSENAEAGQERLEVARTLDPENLQAQEMMGQESPLPPEDVFLPELEAVPEDLELVGPARWDAEAEAAEIEAGEVAVAAAAGALAAEDELPDWLRDVGVVPEEEPALDLEAEESILTEEEMPSEVPDWLQEAVAEEGIPAVSEAVEAEEVTTIEEGPELEQVAGPATGEEAVLEAEEEAWAIDAGVMELEEEEPLPAAAADEDIPEWLRELIGGEVPSAEEMPPEPVLEEESPIAEVAAEEIVSDKEAAEPVPLPEVSEEGWAVEAPHEEEVIVAATIEEEGAPEAEVPASLTALVDAGLLDEADLESAMAEMSDDELESQRAEDIPLWLQELIGEAEEPATEPAAGKEAAPVTEELPSREGDLLPAEETPAWLRELTEPAAKEEEPVVAGRPEEKVTISEKEPPAAEEDVLLVVGEPEEEPPVAEEVALPVVGVPEEEPPAAEEAALPVDEAPEEELPAAEEVALPVVEAPEEELPAAEEAALPVVEAPEEELPTAEETVPAPVAEVPAAEESAPSSRVDELVEQLKTQPRDTGLRLELARLYVAEQDWDAALAQYGKLVSTRKQLPDVIQDLEPLEQTGVDRAQLYQLLGDAYMHQDQLDKALQMYRQARQVLTRR